MATRDDATTEKRAVELAACAADVAYFVHHFGVIDDTQGHGEGGGTMPFHLWPSQVQVLWSFMIERLVLILKARQLGISWLCCAYALWLCLFHPGKVVMLFSKGKLEANELLRRIKVLYERLPDWMREALPSLETDNTTTLGWNNGSRVQSNPATQNAGRSFTASLVILDEAGFLQWATALYTAMKPVIDGGGQLIVLSTANGVGNLFHRLWTRTVAGKTTFKSIFLGWFSRPGRDQAWYDRQVADADDPALVPQEYPSSAQEAFVTSGRNRFKAQWIMAQVKNLHDPSDNPLLLPIERIPEALQETPGLSVYKLPELGRRYVLGADVAEGKDDGEGNQKGDYSAGTLIDAETWEEIASLHGQWEPGTFAGYLLDLASAYDADLAVERNNHGHAVLLALALNGYHKIVCGPDGAAGWLTTAQSKPIMVTLGAEALRDNLCTIRTAAALDEFQNYIVKKNGSTGSAPGFNDDYVMSWLIALTVAHFPPSE